MRLPGNSPVTYFTLLVPPESHRPVVPLCAASDPLPLKVSGAEEILIRLIVYLIYNLLNEPSLYLYTAAREKFGSSHR